MLIQDIIPPVKNIIKPVGKIIKKQSRNKYVSMFLAFLLVFETIAGVLAPFNLKLTPPSIISQNANAAGEGWFSTGGTWTYRRAIVLSSATAAANYQVKVTLTAANFDYTKLSFPSTGADLRFTGSDGTTSQDYWIESWVNGGTSVIWVEVATSGTSTIYMYYGNASASAGSNGGNTFIAFDDFSTNQLGTYWLGNTANFSVGSGLLTGSAGGYYVLTHQIDQSNNDLLLHFETKAGGIHNIAGIHDGTGDIRTTGNGVYYLDEGTGYSDYSWGKVVSGVETWLMGWPASNGINTFEITKVGTTWKLYKGGTLTDTETITNFSETYLQLQTSGASVWDIVYVRKYAATEPTTSIYAEQTNYTYSYKRAITINNTSGGALIDYQVGQITIDTSDAARYHNSCADIRFTTDASNWNEQSWAISYPFWIESGCGTSSTKVWVKVDSIAASSNKTIYIYYGNASAGAGSNISNTMLFGDDFSGSLSNWSGDTSYFTVSGGELSNSPSATTRIISKDISLTNTVLAANIKTTSASTDLMWGLGYRIDASNRAYFSRRHNASYPTRWGDGSVYYSNIPPQWTSGTYGIDRVIVGTTVANSTHSFNGTTVTGVANYGSNIANGISIESYGAGTPGVQYMDWVYVRQYAATEPTTSIYAEQTNYAYSYKRAITIDNTANASTLADYQISTTIDTSDASRFHNSCADIRFTTDATNWNEQSWVISYPFWIESGCGTATTKIWTKVDSIAASSSKTIYMYYGSVSASAGSNGANTFLFFDDFNRGNNDTISNGWIENTNIAEIFNNKLKINKGSADGAGVYKTYTTSGKVLYEGTINITTPSNFIYFTLYGNAINNRFGFSVYSSGVLYYLDNSGWVSSGQTLSVGVDYKLKMIYNVSSQTVDYYLGSTLLASGKTGYTSSITNRVAFGWDTNVPNYDIDNVIVRIYSSPEPTSSVGSETANNTAPTATAPTASQATDGTGYVTIQTTIDDADDNNTVRFQVEYSLDGGSTYTNGDPFLTSYITTSPDQATEPDVTNAQTYQVGMPTNNIITSAGANTVTTKWDTKSASNGTGAIGNETNVKLRITPHDGTSAGTPAVSAAAFAIDNSAPTGGSVQINSNDSYTTSANTTLTLAATGASQMKFSNDNITYSSYEAYGTSKAWDITDAVYGGTSGDGAKTVYAIFKDAFGNESAAVNDNIVYDTTVPVNPTAAIDAQGAVTDTWQNNKNDPNFTSFTGESDANGMAGFYVYFGTDAAGVILDWVATDAYDPASFITSNTRYLRVIVKDNAGLYADPDGAGTTCDNTNANRPADADCWATIFIHKYDIDNPNTPSPISSPATWTNTNSFDFSWINPGDIGGSGVKDYTYQTNAGTLPTTIAGLSINALTSDTNGTKLFSVKANDNAGNSGTNGTVNFYYDNTAPTNAGAATDGNGALDNTWGIVSDPSFTWVAGTDAGDQSGVKEYDVYWGTSSTGTTVTATVATNAYNPAAIPVNTPYYLRIRTRDNALNESAWATKFTMEYSEAASNPSGLSQTANAASLALGDWTTDTTPTLNFTLVDPESDTLGYIVKIDNNSDFSSPEVFYTYSANDLASGAEYSFTAGQSAGTGTYTNGSSGQTLSAGQYYWKVQAIESHGLASGEVTANGGLAAFGIDITNPTGTTLGFGTIAADSIIATVSGAADSGSGLHATPYYFEITTPITPNSGWQAAASWTLGALTANTQYIYQVTSRDKAGNTQTTATQNKYTLANTPSAPTVNNAAPTSLDVNVNVNSNPAATEFAIYKETGATCDGAGGSYLAADGSDNGATAIWQTDAAWGVKTAIGLVETTQYSFCVKARNGELVETAFSAASSGTTGASNQAPNAPVLVSPANGVYTSDATPTLSANYSDPDAGDTGTTNYRITSGTAQNCLDNVSVVASGASAETPDNNENTAWTPGSSIGSDAAYYWCAQNNDGSLSSSWTSMGNFILDTAAPVGTALDFGTIASDSITATVSGAADSGSGLHVTPYYFEITAPITPNSGWQAAASWTLGALTANTQYAWRAKSKDVLNNESSFTATQSKYTLANTPSSLNLTSSSQTQITSSWNANSNPDGTEYYAENTTAGTNSGWITNTSWDSSGLTCETSYSFKIKAKNGDGIETAFSSQISGSTVACDAPASSGGGGVPSSVYNPPSNPPSTLENPAGSFQIIINNGDRTTSVREVALKLVAGADTARMAISNNADFIGASQEPFQSSKRWILSSGDGVKTVYVRFFTFNGVSSKTVSDSIILDTTPITSPRPSESPAVPPEPELIPAPPISSLPEPAPIPSVSPEPETAAAPLPEMPESISASVPEETLVAAEGEKEIISKEAPASMQGKWDLLPQKEISGFVLAPLPREIIYLADKFPAIKKTFKEVGINRLSDIDKLKKIELSLPNLSEIAAAYPLDQIKDLPAAFIPDI